MDGNEWMGMGQKVIGGWCLPAQYDHDEIVEQVLPLEAIEIVPLQHLLLVVVLLAMFHEYYSNEFLVDFFSPKQLLHLDHVVLSL